MEAGHPSEKSQQRQLHNELAALSGGEWDDAREFFMNIQYTWEYFFADMLDKTQSGEASGAQPVNLLMDAYFKDANRNTFNLLDNTFQLLTLEHPELSRYLTRLNFHTMNHELGGLWQRLIQPEKATPLDYDQLSVTQIRLSVAALQLVESRRAAFSRATYASDTMNDTALQLDTSFASRINEVETLITLLEVIRQQPPTDMENLLVLPTPLGGSTSPARSSSFSLIDTENHLIHGIHTQVQPIDAQQNTDRSSYVSGIDDLDNVKIRERADGTTIQQPIPGLIAADIIFNSEAMATSRITESPELKPMTYMLYRSKAIARPLLNHMDYLNRVSYAAAKIGPRVLQGLFKEVLDDEPNEKELS